MRNRTSKKPSFLKAGEPPPFSIENRRGRGPGVIVCDHAGRRVPRALAATLGVSRADLARHVGWDIGAADVARHLSKKLGMPAVLARYTRLAVDLNRDPARPALVMPVSSDDVAVPGNRKLSRAQRQERLDALFWPYQDAIAGEIARFRAAGRVPFILSIHSFTPVMGGRKRPWHVGVLWDRESRIGRAVAENLRRIHPRCRVGENQPYTMKNEPLTRGATLWRHGEKTGLPHLLIECRQDLVDTPRKAARWAGILAKAIAPVLADPKTFQGRGKSRKRS